MSNIERPETADNTSTYLQQVSQNAKYIANSVLRHQIHVPTEDPNKLPIMRRSRGETQICVFGEATQTLRRRGRHWWSWLWLSRRRCSVARTRVARCVDEGARHRGCGRDAAMARTKEMVALRAEGRPPLLPPCRLGANTKVRRPPLLPPRRPSADAKVGHPSLTTRIMLIHNGFNWSRTGRKTS